ncbi:hypothetical protein AB0K60_34160 [Thermopolyspora sp. NPDC052614]|uniref:hypothetical protein n=1 Tax=Thermopolyspora sp. NPDC052614 TaxID=3155682 RepID=UPI00342C1614
MRKIGQVALAGTLGLLGTAACTAEAQSTSPSSTPAATATAPASRQPVRVELNPARTTGGTTKSIRIRAFCPFPQGGTEYRATARSSAFTGVVTLAQPTVTPSANGDGATPATPEVRGFALLSADARPGTYNVEVRCEGTNDTGTARLTITARPRSTPTRTRTTIPTRAPHAGGGGTAAGGPAEDSGIPLPVTGLAAAAVICAGVMLVRRRAR